MCSASFPALSLCLANLYNSFSPSFVSNLAHTNCHTHIPLPLQLAYLPYTFFCVDLFSIFIFYFVPCFLCLFLFFYALLNFLIPPPCPLSPFRFPNITPSTVSTAFLAFLLFCPTHQVTHPHLPNSWSPLSRLTPSVSTIVSLALLFLLFLFHHKSHFAYYHTVLLCDAFIHYYLTIAHFLQVSPSAHHIIYLGTFSATCISHHAFIFILEISIDNCQIHPFPKIHNH